jgi:DNA ligase-1
MSTFKPLLAHTIKDTATLNYPVMASVKLDGIRCVVIDGVAMSRNLKPIKNRYVQECIGNPEYSGLDGELIVGSVFAKDCYRATSSGVMGSDGEPDFKFHVFDCFDLPGAGYEQRLNSIMDASHLPFLEIVQQQEIENEADLLEYEAELLAKGAEGVMVRSMNGTYKQGRSTEKEGILGKLKRFVDHEYAVMGFQERMHNGNEATKDALGRTERSSHQENLVGRGDLGALILETSSGLRFNCGTGFDDELRREIWDNQTKYYGRMAKIKSFPIGVKDLPRFPVFLGFRDAIDA